MELIGAVFAGVITGVLSGWGVGGGTLLLLYLAAFTDMPQTAAQGVNLLYFLPCASAALFSHIRNGLVEKSVFLPAAVCGAAVSALAALLANSLDAALLRRLFGGFLLAVGVSELFRK